ncbi:MAG TPA: LemA family protein [Nocardioidaceae bacterium]|nr:LemA family protein [Nocardioidaceae bacterium]
MVWVVLGLLVLLVAVSVVAFNKLRTADVAADEALGGVDVQMTRRADLIPNLVSTVKGYAAHERAVFDEVTEARAGVANAARSGNVAEKAAAEARLDRAIVNVLAVAEAYPELEASASFLQLQTELAETEDQLAFARQYYNDAAAQVNTLVATLPWLLFAGMAGVRKREFYEAPAGQETPPTVQF